MADPKDYLKELEALNRGPLRSQPLPPADLEAIRRRERRLAGYGQPAGPRSEPDLAAATPLTPRLPVARVEPRPIARPVLPGGPVVLEEVLPGCVVPGPSGGSAYLITSRVDTGDDYGAFLVPSFRDAVTREDAPLRARLPARCRHAELHCDGIVFLDLETTGLGCSPLFLIGSMTWENGGFVVRQYLARDYSEEMAVTELFAAELHRPKLIVSFNGKSFDLPYLRARAAYHSVRLPPEPPHLDLLHAARRAWRRHVPDCKLQTLEQHICGRSRSGDIPGAEIPDAYHRFVRSGDAAELVRIVEHNRLDLITLAELMVRLP